MSWSVRSPRRTARLLSGLLAVLTTTRAMADDAGAPPPPPLAPIIEPTEAMRTSFRLAPFYRKAIDAAGFPIVASEKVSDYGLREAAYLIDHMLEGRDDLRAALVASKTRFAIMAPTELTTDIPEHSDLEPKRYWDRRARGLGATPVRSAVSCGEENLLCLPGDPYGTENILIHEFGHAIHEMGVNRVDQTFDDRLQAAFEAAKAAGLWEQTYAATNHHEYWAEGVQSWFDTNRPPDAIHNDVDTRDELKTYDPKLAALLAEVFGDRPWRYTRPEKRPASERRHLEGFDPAKAGRFEWPKDLDGADRARP